MLARERNEAPRRYASMASPAASAASEEPKMNETGTNVDEIADGIYRINTPIDRRTGQAFSFNQYLLWTTSRSCSTPARARCSRW